MAIPIARPPEMNLYPADFRAALFGLSARQIELLAYLEETEPWHTDVGTAEFLDINLSEKFLLCPDGNRRAYRPWAPVSACKSAVFMRFLKHDGEKTWRHIKGTHLFRLIGYGGPTHEHAGDVLKVLVGNAFN
eukprot:7150234-Pyramimonas_sp.AAC.1